MFIVDAHIDLAYSALRFERDLRQDVQEIRRRESRLKSLPNGVATATVPQLHEGGIGLVFGSLFALPQHANRELPGNERLVYANADEAYRAAVEQLDYYHRLADEEALGVRLVGDLDSLEEVVASHKDDEARLLGLAPLMEGADAVREPEELEEWYERGVRLIGPAWDDTRYAAGAWRGGGGFTDDGYHLMEVMADLGFILDVTHLSEEATFEAFERYEGVVVATHANARALVPGQRQLSDEQIRRLAERDGVAGVVFFNNFLRAGHSKGDPRQAVTLQHVVAHIDHICQLLGDPGHVGIGSDFDGGFGLEDTPAEIESVADLVLIAPLLRERGYSEEDVARIMGGNWLNVLRRAFAGN